MPNFDICTEFLLNDKKKQNFETDLIIYTGNSNWIVPKTAVYRLIFNLFYNFFF